jgi:hypothetical protein
MLPWFTFNDKTQENNEDEFFRWRGCCYCVVIVETKENVDNTMLDTPILIRNTIHSFIVVTKELAFNGETFQAS